MKDLYACIIKDGHSTSMMGTHQLIDDRDMALRHMKTYDVYLIERMRRISNVEYLIEYADEDESRLIEHKRLYEKK